MQAAVREVYAETAANGQMATETDRPSRETEGPEVPANRQDVEAVTGTVSI